MPIKSNFIGWLVAGAAIGLVFAFSVHESYFGPDAFFLLGLIMAATYAYAWTSTPRRPARKDQSNLPMSIATSDPSFVSRPPTE